MKTLFVGYCLVVIYVVLIYNTNVLYIDSVSLTLDWVPVKGSLDISVLNWGPDGTRRHLQENWYGVIELYRTLCTTTLIMKKKIGKEGKPQPNSFKIYNHRYTFGFPRKKL